MKKVISLLLALTMVLSLAVTGIAVEVTASGTCGANATWVLTGDTLTISGTGIVDDNSGWESYTSQIRTIIVEEGITKLGDTVFISHSALEQIQLPDSLVAIGRQVFQSCDSLTTITLPKNVQSIIGDPSSYGSAASTFSGDKLVSIEVDPENQRFYDIDGVLFDRYNESLACYPMGRTATSYTVPEGIKVLEYGCFWFATLTTVYLPDGLKTIGQSAFSGSKLTSIQIPDSVTTIGVGAFTNCDQLTEITLPESVTKIQRKCFASCEKLTSITIKNPECVIPNTPETLTSNVVVKGYTGSTAEAYAKRYGRNFIDIATGEEYIYDLGNAGYLALMPTDVTGTVPVFCSITGYNGNGEIVSYQPSLVLETDTSNEKYQEMLAFVTDLTAACTTDREKAQKISDWVNDNMTYQFGLAGSGHTANGVYSLFKNLNGNCEGYTQLTNFMLHLVGIPNATAISYGHAWSLALLDGEWIMIDSTNGIFDGPESWYDDIINISFSPDGKQICIIDDLSGVKLASYGLLVTDNITVRDISIPTYVTYIYSSVFGLRDRGEGDPYITIRGQVDSYAHTYVKERLPEYYIRYVGDSFVAFVDPITVKGNLLGTTGTADVQLIQNGEVVYSTTVIAGLFQLQDVEEGVYTLRVSKENHITNEYTVTVGEEDVIQDVLLCPVGDVTGDGKVNMKDWNAVYEHINEVSGLTGYSLECADANGDGKVNMKDWNRLYEHVNEINPLF